MLHSYPTFLLEESIPSPFIIFRNTSCLFYISKKYNGFLLIVNVICQILAICCHAHVYENGKYGWFVVRPDHSHWVSHWQFKCLNY